MTEERVGTALIASGGGTDARSIMKAYAEGQIPNIDLRVLVSTKKDAECIVKADKNKIASHVIDSKLYTIHEFNAVLSQFLKKLQIELVFLVGCVIKVCPIDGVAIYNIHPADPHKHGGYKMYGLEVHRRVIREIADEIVRDKKNISDKFYTHPTVHQATMDYDSGSPLLTTHVEIPREILQNYLSSETDLDEAARRLQQHVLPYEWLMLPTAVQIAAIKIIDKRRRHEQILQTNR